MGLRAQATISHKISQNQSRSNSSPGNQRLMPESSILVVGLSSGVAGIGNDGSVDRLRYVRFETCILTHKLVIRDTKVIIFGEEEKVFRMKTFSKIVERKTSARSNFISTISISVFRPRYGSQTNKNLCPIPIYHSNTYFVPCALMHVERSSLVY